MRRAPTGQESAEREDVPDRSGWLRLVRRALNVKRAPTGQESAVWWRERRQIRRALYGEELRRVLYDEDGTIR